MIERVLDESGPAVAVTARLDRLVTGLELCGGLPCWQRPIAMQRSGSTWQTHVRVGPVYRDGARAADRAPGSSMPRGERSRATADNGVLVVGGTTEPVLRAPVSPWLRHVVDGRMSCAQHCGAASAIGWRCESTTVQVRERTRCARSGATRAIYSSRPSSPRQPRQRVRVRARPSGARSRSSSGTFRIDTPAMAEPVQRGGAIRWSTRSSSIASAVAATQSGEFRADARRLGAGTARRRRSRRVSARPCPYLVDLGVTALHFTPLCVARRWTDTTRSMPQRSIPRSAGGRH